MAAEGKQEAVQGVQVQFLLLFKALSCTDLQVKLQGFCISNLAGGTRSPQVDDAQPCSTLVVLEPLKDWRRNKSPEQQKQASVFWKDRARQGLDMAKVEKEVKLTKVSE